MATINGTPAPETLNGTNDPDTINGFGGDDTINGFGGNDVINGGTGVDTLFGGLGNDVYLMTDAANDHVKENAGEGIDEVRTNAASYFLAANVENLTGTAATHQLLIGNALDNVIVGGVGNDSLDGGIGNDRLIGGGGSDGLAGGHGDDVYFVDGNDTVYETYDTQYGVHTANGYDTVLTSESFALSDVAYVEVLRTTNDRGTTAINLTGSNFQNLIYGNDGRNVIVGGGSTGDAGDHLTGNGGDDVYFVNERDLVFERVGGGHDTVNVNSFGGLATYALLAGSEVETLGTSDASLTTALNLTGNEFQNLIYGNEGRNVLTSNGGGDHLNGHGGDDIYFVKPGDLVFEGAGRGSDTVIADASFALTAGSHVETLGTINAQATTAINLTGNALQNLIYGNEGANVLTSNGGGDHLNGGGGNDIYFVSTGDLVFEGAGKGSDTVNADSSYILNGGSHVEVLGTVNAAATTAINLTGNELHNLIYGNEGNNVLTAVGGGDHLHGAGGNDILVEGVGADLLFGGAGNDMFQFQNLGSDIDVVQDFASGADKIDLSLIDANSFLSGNGSFTFIGGNAFSGTAGELRVQMDGTTAFIIGDVNGDKVSDLVISVLNAPPLTSADFIL